MIADGTTTWPDVAMVAVITAGLSGLTYILFIALPRALSRMDDPRPVRRYEPLMWRSKTTVRKEKDE